jgi:nucleoside-diphosphate-sugar epimerase
MKKILVCGAGGFIGHHLVKSLKEKGYWVRGVDLKNPLFEATSADEFVIGDLRKYETCKKVIHGVDTVFQLAADMGGAGFIFTGENDSDIMYNSAQINLHMVELCKTMNVKKVLYTSSACIYPEHNQMDPNNPICSEESAYPANPDSEYGWEKLFSERIYKTYARNTDLEVRVARLHNIFGPLGTWQGGREKAPAAICRKVAEAQMGLRDHIEVWGSGDQTRSFLYVDECVEGLLRLMDSNFEGPVNVGSEEMISIQNLTKLVMKIANCSYPIKNISGPLGVNGRNSDNKLIREKLSWAPSATLKSGLEKTYAWIFEQVSNEVSEKTKKSA